MYARNIDTTISRAKNRRRRWNFALILRHLLENSLEIKFQIPLVTGLKLLAKTFIKETSSFFHCNFNYTGYSAQLRPKFWQEKHRGSQIFEMEKKNLYITVEENSPIYSFIRFPAIFQYATSISFKTYLLKSSKHTRENGTLLYR